MTFIDQIIGDVMPSIMSLVGTSAKLLRTTNTYDPTSGSQAGDPTYGADTYTFGFTGGQLEANGADSVEVDRTSGPSWTLAGEAYAATLMQANFQWVLTIKLFSNNLVYTYTADAIENITPPVDVMLWTFVPSDATPTGDVIGPITVGAVPTSTVQQIAMKVTPPQAYVLANETGQLMRKLKVFAVMDDPAVQPSPDTDDVQIGALTFNIEQVEPIMSGENVAGWWLFLGR